MSKKIVTVNFGAGQQTNKSSGMTPGWAFQDQPFRPHDPENAANLLVMNERGLNMPAAMEARRRDRGVVGNSGAGENMH